MQKNRTSNSDVVLGVAGMYAFHSNSMEWELDTALDEKVPIVGVIPRGQERVPSVVSSKVEECVRLDIKSTVETI